MRLSDKKYAIIKDYIDISEKISNYFNFEIEINIFEINKPETQIIFIVDKNEEAEALKKLYKEFERHNELINCYFSPIKVVSSNNTDKDNNIIVVTIVEK